MPGHQVKTPGDVIGIDPTQVLRQLRFPGCIVHIAPVAHGAASAAVMCRRGRVVRAVVLEQRDIRQRAANVHVVLQKIPGGEVRSHAGVRSPWVRWG